MDYVPGLNVLASESQRKGSLFGLSFCGLC